MKKILFYLFLTASILLSFRIIGILTRDLDRLTEYGFGYLTGLIILLLIASIISFFLGKKAYKKE